jgi:hypothetical protein
MLTGPIKEEEEGFMQLNNPSNKLNKGSGLNSSLHNFRSLSGIRPTQCGPKILGLIFGKIEST